MGLDIYFQRWFYTNTETIDGETYKVRLQKTETFNGSVLEDLIEFLNPKISDDNIANCANYDFHWSLLPEIRQFCEEQISESDDEDEIDLWNELIEYLKNEEKWFEKNQDKDAVMTFSIWY